MDLDFNAIISRVVRVFTFDLTVFREVEEDQMATQQAWAVVIIAVVASAIGAAIGSLIAGLGIGSLFGNLIVDPIVRIIGYLLWAFITYWVGVNMFQGEADFNEMQRVIGFAYAPNVLGIFSIFSCLGWPIVIIGAIWSLILVVMAVKEGLDVDWGSAIVTCIIGWLAYIILAFGIRLIF